MGKFSRDKGARNERLLKDELIKKGWTSRRIPLSGASEGFKGDVMAEKGDRVLKFEVKSRKDAFKSIYAFMDQYGSGLAGDKALPLILNPEAPHKAELCVVSANLDVVLNYNEGYWASGKKDCSAVTRKLIGLRKLLGEADMLAIKDDRKPFLFIRYL